MTLNDTQINALFERGNNFVRMGNLLQAVKDYSTVIENRPSFAPAYYNRGFARQHGAGDIGGAIEDYSRAIDLNPQFAEAYVNRALARHHQEDYAAAINDYTTALKLNPGLSNAYNNRGEAYFMLQDFRAAAEDFRKAHDLKAGYRYALAGLAVSLYALGQADEAQKLWASLITRNPNFRDVEWVRDELGWHERLVEVAADLIAHLSAS